MGITLEKVDAVKDRTGASYAECKYALEVSHGDVLEAIIYIEEVKGVDGILPISDNEQSCGNYTINESLEEFKFWLKELINKGNIARIRIIKGEKEVIDVPVNAGIAAGVIGIVLPPVLAFGVIAAVATKITIELTMTDGSVEVVNKYITTATSEVKEKASELAKKIKNKINEVNITGNIRPKASNKANSDEGTIYSYTVNLDETEE